MGKQYEKYREEYLYTTGLAKGYKIFDWDRFNRYRRSTTIILTIQIIVISLGYFALGYLMGWLA